MKVQKLKNNAITAIDEAIATLVTWQQEIEESDFMLVFEGSENEQDLQDAIESVKKARLLLDRVTTDPYELMFALTGKNNDA